MEEIEAAVIMEYGGSLHKAIRGQGTEQQYMQHLLECVMPHLIPADAVQSKWALYILEWEKLAALANHPIHCQ